PEHTSHPCHLPTRRSSDLAPISTAASAQSTCTGRWSKPLRATISLRSKSMPTRLKDSSKWPHLFKPWQFRTKSLESPQHSMNHSHLASSQEGTSMFRSEEHTSELQSPDHL